MSTLPPEELGTCVVDDKGELCTASASSLKSTLHEGRILFHTGSIGGAPDKGSESNGGEDLMVAILERALQRELNAVIGDIRVVSRLMPMYNVFVREENRG